MTRVKWKLISVLSKIVLILTEDRCTVCVERTIGSQIILDAPGALFAPKSFWMDSMELLDDVGHMDSLFFPFGDGVSVGAR